MIPESRGTLMRIYLDESDRWRGTALFDAIVKTLLDSGIDGATVFKGVEGYGGRKLIHSSRVVDGLQSLPVVIEVLDDEERIRRAIPLVEPMIAGGVITLEKVQIMHYRAGEEADEPAAAASDADAANAEP